MTQTAERAETPGRPPVPESVRRQARFKYARDRVTKMAAGTPAFTDEELAELAAILLARTRREEAA